MPTSEELILNAARTLFLKKGYALTTTRDIASEAQTNVALINYYFRSKENLFVQVMTEQLRVYAQGLSAIANNPDTSLKEKFVGIANAFYQQMEQYPDTPLFVLSELRGRPDEFINKIGLKDTLQNSVLAKQIATARADGAMEPVNPGHVIVNLMSLLVFPFIGKPLFTGATGSSAEQFNILLQERRDLVPQWIHAMFFSKV